LEELERA
jgi:hypothetical protein